VTVNDDVLPCAEARRRGRPRSSEADRAILDAAIEEYGTHGLGGLTVDAVAARAGVSKATIYRRYPSKADLVIAAAQLAADDAPAKEVTGDVRRDVRAAVEHLRAKLNDPRMGKVIRMLIADAERDEQLGCLHREFVRQRRGGTTAMLADAARRGDLRDDIDPALATEQLCGALFYRFLVSGDPIDDAFVDEVVDTFLRAYEVRR
jgi:AcrR family transcriptional regulator